MATDTQVRSSRDDYAASAAYRRAETNEAKRNGVAGTRKKADKVEGDGETLNGINQKSRRGSRRFLRNVEQHFPPKYQPRAPPLRGRPIIRRNRPFLWNRRGGAGEGVAVATGLLGATWVTLLRYTGRFWPVFDCECGQGGGP